MIQSNRKIELVLIGLGKMGGYHLNKIKNDKRFHLKAIVDPNISDKDLEEKIPILKSQEDLEGISYSTVIIATSTETHYEIALKEIQKNKHILIEKPAASTSEQIAKLVELAKENDTAFAVGHIERCNPAVILLGRLIASNLIGTMVHINGIRAGKYPKSVKKGNSVLIDLAVHELDVLTNILGNLQILDSLCHSTIQDGIIDTCDIHLKNNSGTTATVHINWLTPQGARKLSITGTEGVIELDYGKQSLVCYGHEMKNKIKNLEINCSITKDPSGCDKISFELDRKDALQTQLDQFYNYLSGENHHLCTGLQISESVFLCEQIEKNAKNKLSAISKLKLSTLEEVPTIN